MEANTRLFGRITLNRRINVSGKSSKVHKNLNVSVTITFTVAGTGPFPIDMLRHDCCYPARTGDAKSIEYSLDLDLDGRKRRITLISHAHPTVERWNHFGWSIVDGEVF